MRMRWIALAALTGVLVAPRAGSAQGSGPLPRPTPGPAPAVRVPRVQMRTLRNGVRVAILESHEFPVVDVELLLIAPEFLDPAGKEGVGSLTATMLAEGTATRTADQIAAAEADIGTPVSATGFFTVARYFAPAVDLMADQLLHPAFPDSALTRVKANTVAGLQRLKDQPSYLAQRLFANAVYGAGHPYARAQTEQSVSAITREDLVAFHRDYYRPRNVSLIVAGDITPERAVAALEHAFGGWTAGGKDGSITPPAPAALGPTRIYLYDRPTSPQSVVRAGQLGPQRDTKDYYALELVNTILGGKFASRINLLLREVHGYTYGAQSNFAYRRVPEPSTFVAGADVATAKTDSSVEDLMGELRDIRAARPVTDSELVSAKRTATLSLPLDFATTPAVAGAASALLELRLPLDYYDHVTQNFEMVTLPDARGAATRYLDPDHMAIVVVGDRKAVEPGLAAMHVAPVVAVDLEAKPTS